MANNLKSVMNKMRKKITIVTAISLTKTAKEVQQGLIIGTKRRFSIRKAWLERGKYSIRVTPATKDKLRSKIWNDAPWMTGHEEGEERLPQSKTRAVPTSNVRRSKKDLIFSSNKPRNLKNSFIVTDKNDGKIHIFKRTGRGKRSIVKLMYNLIKKAKIAPEWKFKDTGEKIANVKFNKIFYDELLRKKGE